MLLRALRLLHEEGFSFRLILTGGGTEKIASNVSQAIPELEDARVAFFEATESFRHRIEIHGLIPTGLVEDYYRLADIVVLPTLYEGFGFPLAEAVARGKRVLCSDIPAFREQIAIYNFEKAISLVSESTPRAWANAIRNSVHAPPTTPHTMGNPFLLRPPNMDDGSEDYAQTLSAA